MQKQKECQLIRTDKELAGLASKMRSYASKNPLTEEQVSYLMGLTSQEMGVMERIQDTEQLQALSSAFSSFVVFSSKEPVPYQISYMEYEIPGGKLRQLTINNGFQQPVARGLVSRVTNFFFDSIDSIKFITEEIPDYIKILIQKDEDYET